MSAGNFAFLNTFAFLLVPFMIWSFIWKGWALWRAVKNDSKPWFIALLLINTMGILEIIYIFILGKKSKGRK
jgi:hypothetical protein